MPPNQNPQQSNADVLSAVLHRAQEVFEGYDKTESDGGRLSQIEKDIDDSFQAPHA